MAVGQRATNTMRRVRAIEDNYFSVTICHEDYSFFAVFLASVSGTVFLLTNSTYMHTCMHIYIDTDINDGSV